MSKLAILEFLGRTVYYEPEPPPRTRDPAKPMQVICVGFPRSATESLQVALLKLGYDYTYHGWDIVFEEPHYMQAWCRLAKKKWYGAEDGEANITREDFDAILGHSVAVTDAAGSVFAAEMIQAYPEAKVVLNMRRDLEAWHRSAIQNLAHTANDSWKVWGESWLTTHGFWSWMVFERYLWKLLFRATDESERAVGNAIRRNGKWIYREHCNMVRGLVPKDKLLEWDVHDGWEPLCKFLGKDVPDEPFPSTNNPAGFEHKLGEWFAANRSKVRRNLSILGASAVASIALLSWRLAPVRVEGVMKGLQETLRTLKK